MNLDVVVAVEFGVRLVVFRHAEPFEDGGTDAGPVGRRLDDIKIARDVNGAVDGRSLEFRQWKLDWVEIRHGQIQSGALARVQWNGRFKLYIFQHIRTSFEYIKLSRRFDFLGRESQKEEDESKFKTFLGNHLSLLLMHLGGRLVPGSL
jgi:hypothetical protein